MSSSQSEAALDRVIEHSKMLDKAIATALIAFKEGTALSESATDFKEILDTFGHTCKKMKKTLERHAGVIAATGSVVFELQAKVTELNLLTKQVVKDIENGKQSAADKSTVLIVVDRAWRAGNQLGYRSTDLANALKNAEIDIGLVEKKQRCIAIGSTSDGHAKMMTLEAGTMAPGNPRTLRIGGGGLEHHKLYSYLFKRLVGMGIVFSEDFPDALMKRAKNIAQMLDDCATTFEDSNFSGLEVSSYVSLTSDGSDSASEVPVDEISTPFIGFPYESLLKRRTRNNRAEQNLRGLEPFFIIEPLASPVPCREFGTGTDAPKLLAEEYSRVVNKVRKEFKWFQDGRATLRDQLSKLSEAALSDLKSADDSVDLGLTSLMKSLPIATSESELSIEPPATSEAASLNSSVSIQSSKKLTPAQARRKAGRDAKRAQMNQP